MPFADQRAGSCYVWIISTFLFICILAGGVFLAFYITQPETPSTAWYPTAGVSLVCLPWLFWFLTLCYRILSRALGFRMVCWGAPHHYVGDSVAGERASLEHGAGSNAGGRGDGVTSQEAATVTSMDGNAELPQGGDGGKHVHFGAAAAVDGNESRESELPLKLSMAS